MDFTAREVGAAVVATITAVAAWFGGMRQGRAEFINAVQRAANEVMDQLRKEVTRVQTAYTDCIERHEKCEDNFEEYKRANDAEIRKLRAEIDKYFKDPPADYTKIDRV